MLPVLDLRQDRHGALLRRILVLRRGVLRCQTCGHGEQVLNTTTQPHLAGTAVRVVPAAAQPVYGATITLACGDCAAHHRNPELRRVHSGTHRLHLRITHAFVPRCSRYVGYRTGWFGTARVRKYEIQIQIQKIYF